MNMSNYEKWTQMCLIIYFKENSADSIKSYSTDLQYTNHYIICTVPVDNISLRAAL
mgnify:CR=1 FL=1